MFSQRNRARLKMVSLVLTGGLWAFQAQADEALSELHDPMRGLSFYTMQLESEPLISIQTQGSRFSPTDRMTVGLSALVFDEENTVNEYVLWLRHDGPKQWFVGSIEQPLTIQLADRRLTPVPVHVARGSDRGKLDPYIEKLEFALSPALVKILLAEPSIVLRLDTQLGQLEQPVKPDLFRTLQEHANNVATHSMQTSH